MNVVDDFTREALTIEIDTSLCGSRVARVLHRIANERGAYPATLVMDNGTELTSNAMLDFAKQIRVELHYIVPGKPTQNAFIESFNGRFRDECLNDNIFWCWPKRGAPSSSGDRLQCRKTSHVARKSDAERIR